MRMLFFYLVLSLCAVPGILPAKSKQKPEKKMEVSSSLRSLYHSLDPLSILQNLAFYELYPETAEGKEALTHAWHLLSGGEASFAPVPLLPKFEVQSIISLVTRQPTDAPVELSDEQLDVMQKLAERLSHRKLKGSSVWKKEELLALPSEEIDLGRALLIYQFEGDPEAIKKARQYEATLDLMALQISAYLSEKASDEEKIREINRFIFQEMRFRFPPHSLYAKDIDLYTFLPSVLDSRQGVCLGVSILYLCLAQRLDLELDIITPPGHIYLSYSKGNKVINIETTARGINMPSDTYLGINTHSLQKRTMKEVIGLAFFNQASVSWGKEDNKMTVELYEKALGYLPADPQLKMLLGFNYLFAGRKKEGEKLLREVQGKTFEGIVSIESMPEDYLKGRIDSEGIRAIFLHVDETRESILKKQEELKKILQRFPRFRAGLMQLATTYLQLGRSQEALDILLQYHKIDPDYTVVNYYLAVLCLQRLDFNQAWSFLKEAEALASRCDHHPKALKSVKDALKRSCPEPS